MKHKKKTALFISFTLGALLVATTAFAEITDKSGYEQLKDVIKKTAEVCSTELDSFTFEASYEIKDNGKTILSEKSIGKYDLANNVREDITNARQLNGKTRNYYYYSDKTTDIRKGSDDETYYVTVYSDEKEPITVDNPFAEDEMKDIEKIIDALVGGLRDHVQVRENADGSKEIYGSLNEVQIPALINALASFQVKQELALSEQNDQYIRLTQDIFVKGIGGSAQINQEGLLESILGTATLSGKDAEGNTHELTIDVLFRVLDQNSTIISKPDLTGKQVIEEKGVRSYKPLSKIAENPEKYMGLYKNDIIIEKEDSFEKIGERHLEIIELNGSQISGHYTEEYKEGYPEYAANKKQFTFTGTFDNEDYISAAVQITGNDGSSQTGHIYIDENLPLVELYIDQASKYLTYNPDFVPDLD